EPATALDVTCDDPQGPAGLFLCGVKEGDERRAGHHRLDTGDQCWLGPVLYDLKRSPFDHLVERISNQAWDQADEIGEDRKELIDILTREERAAGRRRAAQEALHSKLLGGQQLRELPDFFPVVLVRVNQVGMIPLEALQVGRRDRLEAE